MNKKYIVRLTDEERAICEATVKMRVVTIIESDLSKINSILLLGIVPFPIGRGTERYRSDGQCRPCQP